MKNARTNEIIKVVDIHDADTIEVARGYSTGTPAAAMLAGDSLFIVGNANEEGSGARTVNATQSTPVTNYTGPKVWV